MQGEKKDPIKIWCLDDKIERAGITARVSVHFSAHGATLSANGKL